MTGDVRARIMEKMAEEDFIGTPLERSRRGAERLKSNLPFRPAQRFWSFIMPTKIDKVVLSEKDSVDLIVKLGDAESVEERKRAMLRLQGGEYPLQIYSFGKLLKLKE